MNSLNISASIRKIRKEIKVLISVVSLFVALFVLISNFFYGSHTKRIDSTIPVKTQLSQVTNFSTSTPVFPSNSQSFIARVYRVVDGDTVIVQPENSGANSSTTVTIRLIGINTPETVDPRKKVECFGKEASSRAKELLTKDTLVRIVSDTTQNTKDKYGRILGYLFIPNNTNGFSSSTDLFYNRYMIEEGFAYEYTYDKAYTYQKEFKEAQIEAKSQERGLWSVNACNGDKNL